MSVTVVLLTRSDPSQSGHRIAQVHVVFQIPTAAVTNHKLFHPSMTPPNHIAYVEWFSPLSATRDANHLMYKVTRSTRAGRRSGAIIPVESILCSVHLIPQFGSTVPQSWNTFSVLEECHTFFINPFIDRNNYVIFGT